MAIVITQSDLLDALTAANAAPAEARTVAELAGLIGWTKERVRDAIGKLAMQDRINVHQVQKRRINGQMGSIPAYTILPAKPKRGK